MRWNMQSRPCLIQLGCNSSVNERFGVSNIAKVILGRIPVSFDIYCILRIRKDASDIRNTTTPLDG
jgi:hypothetical protein